MCFTCATYTDLSFLIANEILRVWLNSEENIQAEKVVVIDRGE